MTDDRAEAPIVEIRIYADQTFEIEVSLATPIDTDALRMSLMEVVDRIESQPPDGMRP